MREVVVKRYSYTVDRYSTHSPTIDHTYNTYFHMIINIRQSTPAPSGYLDSYPALSVPAERPRAHLRTTGTAPFLNPDPMKRSSAPLAAHNDRNTARLVFLEPRSLAVDPEIPTGPRLES